MQKILGLLVGIAFVAASSTALAEDKKGGDKGGGGGKVKVYDFSGDTIEGDLIKPEGSTVDARDFAKHSSLIRIRKDFISEIIKSAEDLQ
jgi:hypothetical protein